ncbi:uncharacterized protein LOC119908718 [Micropterus salmoides]|uniref:uncharacterized protein LOC119908718 n=1 Tax=Micropterus salmoides TaxID=27706 RepID=UPI0018EE401D|nr:uncharacterized protein LOC119908718 [Micropterus salmoides]
MSSFRWVKMSLFLVLLHLTAVTGQYSPVVVRDGDDVTIPCENVRYNQNDCEYTNWLVSGAGNTPSVELVARGQIGETAMTKPDKLSVTANCSLVIKKVTVEDVGRYSCRQLNRSGEQQGQDARVYLSVLHLDEYRDHEKVLLSCSVSTYAWCSQRVNWLFNGKDVDIKDVSISQTDCLASVHFKTSHYIYTSRYESFVCEATDIYTGKVLQFTFSHQSSGDDTTVRTDENSYSTSANDTTKSQGWWRLVILSVGLAALLTAVVAVNMWTRTKRNTTQTNENTVHNEEDDGAPNYENPGDSYVSVH